MYLEVYSQLWLSEKTVSLWPIELFGKSLSQTLRPPQNLFRSILISMIYVGGVPFSTGSDDSSSSQVLRLC